MPALPTIAFDSAIPLAAGLTLAAAAAAVAAVRGASAPMISHALGVAGFLLLAVAAGEPRMARNAKSLVAVMVDRSASMRGASYHDDATLRSRIADLLGDRPHALIPFGDGSAQETTWTPPPPEAAAVLLFSDGRFKPPVTSPPVYAVTDPALDEPADAAVTSLERRGERIVATTRNESPPRELTISGAGPTTRAVASTGSRTFTFAAAGDGRTSTAQLSGDDRWPENDALMLTTPPRPNSERWWVGGGAPDAAWRSLASNEMPTDPAAYLAPSVIVLNNVAATSLSAAQGGRLHQYVRDLGGGLVILGGDRAFAAGGYDGSVLDALAPLASSPPTPAAHWTFLLDASGSMAGTSGGDTRLATAVAAARGAFALLPPNDVVSVGGFSDTLRWWTRGRPVKDFTLPDPPASRGPTNLDAALRAAVASLDPTVANPLIVLTDGQVQLDAFDDLEAALRNANARLHIFAIGSGSGLAALRQLAEATGGTFAEQIDPSRWAAGLAELLRQIAPRHWMTTPVEVRFDNLPAATATGWNRTWLKPAAEALARGTGDDAAPMAAVANVGSGKVAAAAFRPPEAHVAALAERVASPPRDPRLKVTWRTGRELIVDLDAADATAPLNGLSPTLVLSTPAGGTQTLNVPQTGPGRYALALRAPRSAGFATLHESGRIVDRFAVAGRYAAEFDAVGNDHAALSSLAGRTGGRVVEPAERGPLPIRTTGGGTRLAPFVAAAGALLVALGLITSRVKR